MAEDNAVANIDIQSLNEATPPVSRPFGDACLRVLERADVRVTLQTRQLASHICGVDGLSGVAVLDEDSIEEQAEKLAERAEARVDSPMVLKPIAKKIALAAILIRLEDGSFEPEEELSREERSQRARDAYAARHRD